MAVPDKINSKAILQKIWETVRKILSFFTTIIIITAILVTVLFLAKIKPYVVITPSMEPAIPVHSVCFVNENTPLKDIAVGEVISFRMGKDMLVTHRVSAITEKGYITKGDANEIQDDAPITEENYIGKTILVIPKAGHILIFLHSKKGKVTAIVFIALLLAVSFLPKKKPEDDEQ